MRSELGAKLQNLQKLYLINNMLSELGMLQNLEILYCHINALGGGGRSDLFYVNLLDNDITGSIPDSVGDLSRLRLYFFKNRILGSIPDDMGKMSSLCVLDLGKKLIGGSFPPSLGNLLQLRYLNLSENHLSGSIPVLLGLLSRLDFSINLPNSHFEGQLPASIGKLVSLQAIDFSKNKNLGEHLYPGGLEEGACKLTLNEKISIATDIGNGKLISTDQPKEHVNNGLSTRINWLYPTRIWTGN
ncbi:hypothetical protein ACFX1R_011602 [Malus domestica]